jgi:hypothetical protein
MNNKKWYFYIKVDTIKGVKNYYVGSVDCAIPERTFFNKRLIRLLSNDKNYIRGIGYTDNESDNDRLYFQEMRIEA